MKFDNIHNNIRFESHFVKSIEGMLFMKYEEFKEDEIQEEPYQL